MKVQILREKVMVVDPDVIVLSVSEGTAVLLRLCL